MLITEKILNIVDTIQLTQFVLVPTNFANYEWKYSCQNPKIHNSYHTT